MSIHTGPDRTRADPPAGLAGVRARVASMVQFQPREVVALALLGVLLVAGAGIAFVRARPVVAGSVAPLIASPEASASGEGTITVHVVGAVRKPGVYTFAPGDRVQDAVRAAGGFARDADQAAINLARPLVDGEQIVVPKRGEAPGMPGGQQQSAPASGGKVNINIAGEAELETLPGIGPVLAQRIVEYRAQHGSFRSVRDLLKVPGIGDKKFASLEPHVTV